MVVDEGSVLDEFNSFRWSVGKLKSTNRELFSQLLGQLDEAEVTYLRIVLLVERVGSKERTIWPVGCR